MSLKVSSPDKNYKFSRSGFQPLPNEQYNMSTNDATIDIPLEHVNTNSSGLRNKHSMRAVGSPDKEKHSLFRGRRHRVDPNASRQVTVGYDGEEDTITTMGKVYQRILNFSIVTRYFLYVLPIALIIAVPIVIGATAAPGAEIGGVRILWFFTWIMIVWLSLWVSKLFAHFLPFIFQVLVGVVNSGIRKYALVIRALEIPLSLVGWAIASLATFMPIMTKNPTLLDRQAEQYKKDPKLPDLTAPQEWEYVVQNVLAAALVSSIILLVEKTLVQLISINYHRKQFNARIKESKHNVYLLSLLYDASTKLFPAYCNEFAEEDYTIADQLNLAKSFASKAHARSKSGVITPLRFIQDVGRYGDKITSAFGNIAHEVTGKDAFNPNSSHSVVVEALERKRTSEALARRIWMSFVVEGNEALTQEDLVDVLGPGLEDSAIEAFAALDRDGNGDVSLDEMILTVTEYSRERKSVASSMHDVDQAINVLDKLLMMIVLVATVLVFVGFLNANFTSTLATTGTAILSLSFVFAATCQEVLGSCIFLFVKHPFDIGDRVDISTDQYVVEHISLLFTVFRRVTGTGVGRLVQVPNITLSTVYIENVTRSKLMTEQVKLSISFDTSFEDIQMLKNELLNFVTDKDNSRDFQPSLEVDVLGTTDMTKLDLLVEIRHKSNWSNETIRAARRSKFMCALVAALRAVPIYAPGGGNEAAGTAANPNYSVAISDIEAKDNIKAAADKKEGKRMVVRQHETGQPEEQIITNLTSRNPAVDVARDEAWTSGRDDSSTLSRHSTNDQQIEEVRGLLRRESTKGKRKAGTEYGGLQRPGVPTIAEPVNRSEYTYPHLSPGQVQPLNVGVYKPRPSEMTQIGGSTASTIGEATRLRSESVSRKPLQPPPIPEKDDESRFQNTRPYSGV